MVVMMMMIEPLVAAKGLGERLARQDFVGSPLALDPAVAQAEYMMSVLADHRKIV